MTHHSRAPQMPRRAAAALDAYVTAYIDTYHAGSANQELSPEWCHHRASVVGQRAADRAHETSRIHWDTGVLGALACGQPSGLITRDFARVSCTQCLCSAAGKEAGKEVGMYEQALVALTAVEAPIFSQAQGPPVHYGDAKSWLSSLDPDSTPWVCGAGEGVGTAQDDMVTCPACLKWIAACEAVK